MHNTTKILYGWYSVKQSKVCGVVRYKTPQGKIVEVTNVSSEKDHKTKWDDISYIGEVVEYVDRISEGEIDFDSFERDLDNPAKAKELLAKLHNLMQKATNEQSKPEKDYRWN